MSYSTDDDGPIVCIAHGAFIPCRKDGEHRYASNPYWVKAVRDYHTSPLVNLTWEPAWEHSAENDAPRWQLRWWRSGGFRWPWLARRTKGRWGMGRWTQGEVDRINARAAEWHARVFPPGQHAYEDNDSAGRDCRVCDREAADPIHDIPPEKKEE